jgi:hypothetical protein
MKTVTQSLVGLIVITVLATNCGRPETYSDKVEIDSTKNDTMSHGYNELANPDQRESFTISDYNTDNPKIENIKRPAFSTTTTQLDTTALFAILDK